MTKANRKLPAKTATKKPATTATAKKASAKAPASATEEGDKVGKTQLVERLAGKSTLTRQQASSAVDATLEVVMDALKSGKSVGLPGLGTLSVKATAARAGVKPGTSEKIQIPAGKKVTFKVATTLKSTL